MKPTLLKILTYSLLIFFGFSACKKDSPRAKTKTELLTQTTWVFNKATAGGFDISSQVPACFKDNILTFVSNGTGTINESTNVCTPSTAGPFTWSFQNNETVLMLSAALITGGSGNFTLITLNETDLVISQQMTIPPSPTPVTVEITFKH